MLLTVALLLLAQAAPERSTYKVGETIVFRVRNPTAGKASYTISEDGRVAPLVQGTLEIPGQVSVTLDHPGFVLLEVKREKTIALAAEARRVAP